MSDDVHDDVQDDVHDDVHDDVQDDVQDEVHDDVHDEVHSDIPVTDAIHANTNVSEEDPVEEDSAAAKKPHTGSSYFERPDGEHTWRYSGRDLIDEALYGLLGLAGAIALLCTDFPYHYYCAAGVGILTLIWWLYVAFLFFVRRVCVSYKLTPQRFEYTYGFLRQKVEWFTLADFEKIELNRTIWERIIGTGTIIIEVNDSRSPNKPRKIRLPGIREYNDLREKLYNYSMYFKNYVARSVVRG